MKRIIAACLCAAMLLLSGCGARIGKTSADKAPVMPSAAAAPQPTPTQAPEPTPSPTPETSGAQVVSLEARAVLAVLERGEELRIEDEWENYYIVDTAKGRGYIEKRLAALVGEETEPSTVYAKSKAEFYTGYLLRGEPEQILKTNTELLLLADLGDCCLVELDGVLGYVPSDMLSENRIQSYTYFGGGGGGGGGAPSGGADGGDITLAAWNSGRISFRAERAEYLSLSSAKSGTARVISAEAELYAAIYQRSEQVRVFSQQDDICTLYIDGAFATVERRCLLLQGDESFESRIGYAASGAELFRGIELRGEVLDSLDRNTELTLLWGFGDCYLVSLPDGTMGYVAADKVNDKPIVYSYYGGGGGGGASGGGGGGAEWTEPVL